MKPRTLLSTIRRTLRTFPAVVVTGPRQSGKTTLLQTAFGRTYSYVSLENSDVRIRAKEDPIGFLGSLQLPVILDEIQYAPELLSYLKSAIDDDRRPGRWILTGSQHFSLMQGVSQSLAGRAAILSLLPFSLAEHVGRGTSSAPIASMFSPRKRRGVHTAPDLATVLLRGSYPEIASHPTIDRNIWYGSYVTTYLERDIRNIQQVGDLGQYELFLRACAIRTGQILDLTNIARDLGISVTTAKRWLSLLEAGYQIHLLYPYYRNIGKRLVKRPKLYVTDTGLASYLLGITTAENLLAGPHLGPLFETFVINDFWKRFHHHGQRPSLYYLRTRDGLEIDLVVELEGRLTLLEMKATSTITPKHATPLVKATRDVRADIDRAAIVSMTRQSFPLKGITNYAWDDLLLR